MKYFSITPTDNLNEIGYYPQIIKREGYNPTLPNGYWNVNWENFPEFIPNYEVNIHPKAKPTNFLDKSPGLYGLIIDMKFKEILECHLLPEHKFYSINVYYKENRLEYYWFHFINNITNYLSIKDSSIEIFSKTPFKVIEEVEISSFIKIHEITQNLPFEKGSRIKKIVLNENFPLYDIISLWNLAPIFLISEKLKIALESNGINGFEIKEFEKLHILS